MEQNNEVFEGPVAAPVPTTRVAVRTREDDMKSAIARTPITDLATMSDEAFDMALQRAKLARRRVEKILDEMLVSGAHYGNPTTSNGRTAFKKPILFQAGAEHLETTFRLTVYETQPGTVTEIVPPTLDDRGNEVDPGFVSVTVHRALYTMDGTQVGTTTANCNSREKRFRAYGDKGWTYKDARETLNDCIAMAEKRAKVRLVRGALGLTPWLANEDEMAGAAKDDKPVTPWTDEEKKRVYDAATAAGMKRRELGELVRTTLGSEYVGTGEDVKKLLAAIADKWSRKEPEQETEAGLGV
jgi:hypothetical protein